MKAKTGAIELSMNFIIIIIISVLILGAGFLLLRQSMGVIKDINEMSQLDIDKQIVSLNCPTNDKFCLSSYGKTTTAGKAGVVTVKVANFLDTSRDFEINTTKGTAIDVHGNLIVLNPLTDDIIFKPIQRTITINNNEAKSFGIAYQVQAGSQKGTYTLHVSIGYKDGADKVKYDDEEIFNVVIK